VKAFIHLRAPENEGIYAVNYSIPSMGYSNVFRLYVKSPTVIKAAIKDDVLILRVVDTKGKNVKGYVYINNKKFYDRGVLRINIKEFGNAGKLEVYYPGDDTHLPSKAEVSKPLPFWVYLLPIPLIILIALKLRKKRTLKFHYTPPLIWLPGDEVRIKVTGEGLIRLSLDGKKVGFESKEFVYSDRPGTGKHELLAEILNEKGKVVEKGKLQFFVLPFWRALAKVFEELVEFCERETGKNLKDLTVREVLDVLGVEGELKKEFLSFFEPNRYGDREEGSREDIVRFYELCRRIIEKKQSERTKSGGLTGLFLRRCQKCW